MSDGLRADPQEGTESLFHARDEAAVRAAKWEPFELLRTVVEQSSSSLVVEALLTLDRIEADIARLRDRQGQAWPMTPEESGCGCGDYRCEKCCPGEVSRG